MNGLNIKFKIKYFGKINEIYVELTKRHQDVMKVLKDNEIKLKEDSIKKDFNMLVIDEYTEIDVNEYDCVIYIDNDTKTSNIVKVIVFELESIIFNNCIKDKFYIGIGKLLPMQKLTNIFTHIVDYYSKRLKEYKLEKIDIIKYKNSFFVFDGHHRLLSYLSINKNSLIPCEIFDIKDNEASKNKFKEFLHYNGVDFIDDYKELVKSYEDYFNFNFTDNAISLYNILGE